VAYINLGVDENEFPGISGPLRFRPETAKPIRKLTEVLLVEPNSLSRGERELIAAYVSGLNECKFCHNSHSAFAAEQLDEGMKLVRQVVDDLDSAPISEKLRALLRIAGAVQESGRKVTPALIEAARSEGATDIELHDTVLIAAAFCMANRYVDGLGAIAPNNPAAYAEAARHIAASGYVQPE
jgi:uncharacterized peroxidase-related enzyme